MAPGRKTGGRTRGTPNNINVPLRNKIKKLKNDGKTPVEFMLNVMLDEEADIPLRMRAAESAAPYVHARKVQSEDSVTLKTDEGSALVELVSTVSEVLGRLRKKRDGETSD